MRWKIFYSDGSTFSCEDGSCSLAPGNYVQVIVQEDPDHNWSTLSERDFYLWDARGGEGPCWWGADIFALHTYLVEPGLKKVLFGTETSNKRFAEIFKMAYNDPEWGKKAAFGRKERRP
jgi:hypothetical protein